MASVRVSCPTCGDVVMPAETVTVFAGVDGAEGLAVWSCPNCGRVGRHGLLGAALCWMRDVGWPVVQLPAPAEMSDIRRAGGPPLDRSYVERWDDWVVGLVGDAEAAVFADLRRSVELPPG